MELVEHQKAAPDVRPKMFARMVDAPATMLIPSPTPAARRIIDPPSENMTVKPVMMIAAVEMSKATGPVNELTMVCRDDSQGRLLFCAASAGDVQTTSNAVMNAVLNLVMSFSRTLISPIIKYDL